ncbi:Hypothetical predicted protein, partial [Scomber scombrus]
PEPKPGDSGAPVDPADLDQRDEEQLNGNMQMVSWAIQWVPQWSFTGGINSLVVNTLCVANTGGKDGIMEGTDGVKKKKKKKEDDQLHFKLLKEREDKHPGPIRPRQAMVSNKKLRVVLCII